MAWGWVGSQGVEWDGVRWIIGWDVLLVRGVMWVGGVGSCLT